MKNKWFQVSGLADNGSVISFPFYCFVNAKDKESAGKRALNYTDSYYKKVWRINFISNSKNPHSKESSLLSRVNGRDDRIILD